MTVPERLTALRAEMKKHGIDAWLVPTDDFHSSEYVGNYFKCREFITGFTGSAGPRLIWETMFPFPYSCGENFIFRYRRALIFSAQRC